MNLPTSFYISLSNIPEFDSIINNDDNKSLNILKVNKMTCKTSDDSTYNIVSYDKNVLSYDLIPSYGLCRSIIINKNNHVVCFSPPKSIPTDRFITLYPDKNENCNISEIIAEEFVEGTMINVFWDPSIGLTGGWEISTRNTVGATSTFYKSSKSQTFRSMFLEAAKENNLILDNLNRLYCYSFVLQHPNNRIVVPFKKPQLYLVAMYHINNNDKNNIKVYSINIEDIKKFDWGESSIKFPEIYSYKNYSELIEKYSSMNTPYDILGVILYNKKTGERAKIRNPVYEQVRSLRGNQPKLQYQYLCLRKEGKVKDFLKFYPESKKDFSTFRDQVHLFTETLFSNYLSCYVKKEKPLKEFSEQYRTHMFNIHQKYINELREKKMFVTNSLVINYVNELHPSLLMYCLNHQMRKRNVDYIKAENNI